MIPLRDPVDRAVSLFQHHHRKGRVPDDLWRAAETEPSILTAGDYAEHVGRWRETLGEDRVLVVLLDDIETDPAGVLAQITTWAGLSPLAPAEDADRRVNVASAPRWPLAAKLAASAVTALHAARLHRVVALGKRIGLNRVYSGASTEPPGITSDDRQRLVERYAPHVAYVEELLGCETGWLAPRANEPPEASGERALPPEPLADSAT